MNFLRVIQRPYVQCLRFIDTVRLTLSMFCDIVLSTMFVVQKNTRIFLYLLAISAIIYGILIIKQCVNERFDGKVSSLNVNERNLSFSKKLTIKFGKRKFSSRELANMSTLGKWLVSAEKTLPFAKNQKKKHFIILIWKYGPFLERRHIKRFTNTKFSPWENCTVNDCSLSYDSRDLNKADAVLFHLHLTRSVKDLPVRTRWDQKWIFLSDESPMHTFLYKNQNLSDYNGLFNWSMSYRMDSDIPVPYGRTIAIFSEQKSLYNSTFLLNTLIKMKTKLVAVLGSNCSGKNQRWEYIRSLKIVLGNKFDIYGRCMGGNRTSCPGHFDRDCPVLNAYKFYLAFENSNCKEYLTEKVFWNGYKKFSIPVIMGPSRNDCERLLPPGSFLHVDDFANPIELANYLKYLDHNNDNYIQFHEWRRCYEVLNEHGYFGSASRHYCRICEALHYNSRANKVYSDLDAFWSKNKFCS